VSEPTSAEIDEISEWLLANAPASRRLTSNELSLYAMHEPHCGWLVPFELGSVRYDLRVVVPRDFPWGKPRVYCQEYFQFKQFPHIEKDGAFCLFPPSAEHDPYNAIGLIWDTIKEAGRLIAASRDPAFLDDFAEEFASYWEKTAGGKTVVSLLTPGGPSRIVSLWRSTGDYYLADNDQALRNWLNNHNGGRKWDFGFEVATHLVLDRPILPTEYPKSGAMVAGLVQKLAPSAQPLLIAAAEDAEGKFTVSFEGTTKNGPVFFAVEVMPPKQHGNPVGSQVNMIQKGFRPGKVPPYIRLQRQLGGNKVEQHEVLRADPSWVHGRDTPGNDTLFNKRVLLVGTGSLGSEVAQLLSKSGVGSITLIDPEVLEYANVGRHVLGIGEARTYKAKSLAEKLRKNYPHMLVKHFSERWQSLYAKQPEVFRDVDLIVSTIGNWQAEGRLNQLARSDLDLPNVLYGWAEPFSLAGHAVLVGPNGPCFGCGMDQFGRPIWTVFEWDTDTTRKLPDCGASFQPYGPISLASVAMLVAKTAAKALLGGVQFGTETVCWASQADIFEQGGQFSAGFLDRFAAVPEFGGSRVFHLDQRPGCPFCGGK
jgi:molybdopterin/thiamine biosynthesis adenylyltransferase